MGMSNCNSPRKLPRESESYREEEAVDQPGAYCMVLHAPGRTSLTEWELWLNSQVSQTKLTGWWQSECCDIWRALKTLESYSEEMNPETVWVTRMRTGQETRKAESRPQVTCSYLQAVLYYGVAKAGYCGSLNCRSRVCGTIQRSSLNMITPWKARTLF